MQDIVAFFIIVLFFLKKLLGLSSSQFRGKSARETIGKVGRITQRLGSDVFSWINVENP